MKHNYDIVSYIHSSNNMSYEKIHVKWLANLSTIIAMRVGYDGMQQQEGIWRSVFSDNKIQHALKR